jgi:pimeloyl-ACP methyl ester carboxylesterase
MNQALVLNEQAAAGNVRDELRQLTVENIPIAMIDRGSGPPTLLLHGIFDSADTWQEVIPHLQGGLRCLVPDLPGFGRSGEARDFDGRLPHLAQFIEDLLAAARIEGPVNVVGFDIGATYGLAWAVTHPERVRRLAILNSNFFSDYRWHPWARVWRTPILGELILGGVSEKAYANAMLKAAPRLTPERARAAARLVTSAAKRMALRHYRALDSATFRGWEDRLLALTARVPTLVCWGDQDPFVPASWADRFGAQEVHHFAEYSHWLPLEMPEVLGKRLAAFLSGDA